MVMMMADAYDAPQLKKSVLFTAMSIWERTAYIGRPENVGSSNGWDSSKVRWKCIEEMRRELLNIAEDGKIAPDEEEDSWK